MKQPVEQSKTFGREMFRQFIYWIILLFAVEWVLVWQLQRFHNERVSEYLAPRASNLELQYKGILSTFEASAFLIFSERISKPPITRLMAEAINANDETRAILRDSLYRQLLLTYRNMHAMSYRQLHFHLPNNESFLRFHRPQKFGDNLTGIRSTVEAANTTQGIITGFEEGRIFNGFRYVFPLSYHGQHVGTVETSISFNAIREQLYKHQNNEFCFMLKKEVIEKKAFPSERNNYQPCVLSPKYAMEVPNIDSAEQSRQHNCDSTLTLNLSANDRKAIAQMLDSTKRFSYHFAQGNKHYVLSFCPVFNYDKKHVGFFFMLSADPVLAQYISQYYSYLWISVVFVLIAIGVLAFMLTNRQIINHQNQKLENMLHTQNRLFSIIAHDLRSPFNAILGFGQILEDELVQSRSDLVKYIRQINQSAHNTFYLLENLLAWSRRQQSKNALQLTVVEAQPVINGIINQHTDRMQQKELIVYSQLPANTFIYADVNAFEMIVRNLLVNAIKFTPRKGEIRIESRVDAQLFYLTISDSGVGMTAEQISQIQNLKQTISKPGTEQEAGAGLGLSLCFDFTHQMNGELRISSRPQQGTTVELSLPLAGLRDMKQAQKQFDN